jgi:hypothetical protein
VVNKDKEGENKAFEEIERLVNQPSNKDNKTQKDEAKLKKEKERLAKEKAKKEAEEAKKAKKEADRLAKEQAKKEAEEAKAAKKEAEKLAKEQAKKDKEDKQTAKEAAPEVSSDNYKGEFQLVLPSPAGFKQVRQLSDSLAARDDVKVVWTGGSADEGALIAISVAEPVPLARILSDMPMVEGVEVKGDKIHVTLRM